MPIVQYYSEIGRSHLMMALLEIVGALKLMEHRTYILMEHRKKSVRVSLRWV